MDVQPARVEEEDERLAPGGGRFRSAALEACLEAERLPDTRRHARLLFAAAALLNAGFLPVDWRFRGTAHLWVAVPARLEVIATALVCLLIARRDVGSRTLTRTMIGWMAGTALGVALLVTSDSTLAQFVVVMLPVAYYLAVPAPFRWTLIGGAGCSAALLLGYLLPRPATIEDAGLVLASFTMNVALALAAMRSNRLARTAWLAARSARRLGEALADSRAALEQMFLASPLPLVLTAADDGEGGREGGVGGGGRILAMSRTAAALFGEEHPATLRQFYAGDGVPDPLLLAIRDGGGSAELEMGARLADGTTRTLMIRAAAIELPDGRAILSSILDITARKAAFVNLEQIAATDALTGLRNRLSFFAAARAEMTRTARARLPLSLLMVDIDHFKAINDTHGHSAGDAVLRGFAAICATVMSGDAIVGRLGGEEFGVLLPGIAIDDAQALAERLCATVADARTAAAGGDVAITISVGVARVLPQDRDLDRPLARADLALYAAKRTGRNRVVVDGEGGGLARAQG